MLRGAAPLPALALPHTLWQCPVQEQEPRLLQETCHGPHKRMPYCRLFGYCAQMVEGLANLMERKEVGIPPCKTRALSFCLTQMKGSGFPWNLRVPGGMLKITQPKRNPRLLPQAPADLLQCIYPLIPPEPLPTHLFLSKPNLPSQQSVLAALPGISSLLWALWEQPPAGAFSSSTIPAAPPQVPLPAKNPADASTSQMSPWIFFFLSPRGISFCC